MITLVFFTIGAAFVQRTTGFGFGIFIMTVLPWLMPSYGEATTTISVKKTPNFSSLSLISLLDESSDR